MVSATKPFKLVELVKPRFVLKQSLPRCRTQKSTPSTGNKVKERQEKFTRKRPIKRSKANRAAKFSKITYQQAVFHKVPPTTKQRHLLPASTNASKTLSRPKRQLRDKSKNQRLVSWTCRACLQGSKTWLSLLESCRPTTRLLPT